MSGDSPFPLKRTAASRALFLFALVAVFVVLAGPVCDVHRLQGSLPQAAVTLAAGHVAVGAEAGSCCAELGAVPLIAATTWTEALDESSTAVPPAWAPPWRSQALALSTPLPPDRPPIVKPYYARSARMLI